jgi:AcrR family transcriptional regulator
MPKKVDHEIRREELVRAAWRIIADRGMEEVTIRELARESGYSSGVMAHYFKSKDDLLANASRMSHEEIYKRYEAEVETPVKADALRAILMDNLPLDEQRDRETKIEMSFWARSVRNEAFSTIQHEKSVHLRELLRRLAEASQEEGAIAEDEDLGEVVDLLAALIDGLSLHGLLYPELMPPKRQEAIMEFALRHLKDGA